MALQLCGVKREAAPVMLGSGAAIMIRPATAFEVSQARETVTRLMIGLIAGEDAAAACSAALGEEFAGANFADPAWRDAAASRLALLELTWLCQAGWSGVVDQDGAEIEQPTREHIALLLRDAVIAARIDQAVQAPIHREYAEGNGSAASPSGAAAKAAGTA